MSVFTTPTSIVDAAHLHSNENANNIKLFNELTPKSLSSSVIDVDELYKQPDYDTKYSKKISNMLIDREVTIHIIHHTNAKFLVYHDVGTIFATSKHIQFSSSGALIA